MVDERLIDYPGYGARAIDVEFIEKHTHGFEALADDLRVTSWDIIEQQSGLKREDLATAAAIYANAKAVIGDLVKELAGGSGMH